MGALRLADLPMDVWARIASFLSFSELIRTFCALRDARALPESRTTDSNALLQFCSQRDDEWVVAAETPVGDIDDEFRASLMQMGFDAEVIERSVDLCDGNEDRILDYLMYLASLDG